jgi:hypothetical protein
MIHRLIRFVLPIAFAATLVACGGGGGLTVDELFDSQAATLCAKAFECRDSWPGTDAEFEMEVGTDQADCEANLTANVQETIDSVEAGRLNFDEDAASECLSVLNGDVDAASCEDLWAGNLPDEPAVCDEIFSGAVEDGGECEFSEECASETSSCVNMTCGPG